MWLPHQGRADMAHCFDLQPGDILFWYTDIGWMMGPWAIAGRSCWARPCSCTTARPTTPNPTACGRWSSGTASLTSASRPPPYARSWPRRRVGGQARPVVADVLGSTGEPWNPDPWWWYFRKVGGSRCPIINYSVGPRFRAAYWPASPLPIKPRPSTPRCRAWPPTL